MTTEEIAGRAAAELSPAETPAPGALALADSRRVRVRPASLADADSLRGMFSRLSRETIYLRFHAPYPRVPEWAVAGSLDVPDGEALVAVAGEEVIGHAMAGGSGGDGREAEVAVLVEDAWQSRGVGKLLLSRLAGLSGERGVETLFCVALGENRRVLDLVRAVFDDASYTLRDGAYLIRVPVGSLRADPGTAREGR